MLSSLDDHGVLTGFDFQMKQFVPLLDLKVKYPLTFKQIWVVGISDNEILAIDLPNDHTQPHMKMKNLYKRIPLQIPLIGLAKGTKGDIPHQDEKFIMSQLAVNHEQYRKDVWEPLKNFRGRYESAKILSDNILEAKEITLKKKELDKLTLNLIKTCIVEGHDDKVYSYIDNLCFKQSYKLSIKLCSSLKNNSLANKVAAYIQDKEQRSLIESHQTLAKEVTTTAQQNQNVAPTP